MTTNLAPKELTMNTIPSRSSLLAIALASLAGAASAQTGAYDGFDYPAGASLIGQTGGSGFSTPWQSAGYGGWSGDCTGMFRLKVWQLMQGVSGSARSSSGGLQRSLAAPIAGTPGTSVWVSFLARHSGPTSASWLGIKLPCSGPGSDPFVFLGKPFGQSNWGVDNGSPGGVQSMLLPAVQKIRCVARIDFRAGRDDLTVWADPALSTEPSVADAALHIPAYGNFADLRKVLIETGSTGASVSNSIDEVRIGASYAEVTPIEPGHVLDGLKVKPKPGSTTIITSAGPGAGPHVRVAGTPGVAGCAAEVELNSVEGGSVFIGSEVFATAGGQIKIKHKGWDGLIYGRSSMSRSSDGSLQYECDSPGTPVTAIRSIVRDGNGTVVRDETTPGPLGHIVNVGAGVIVSGPCPGGGYPDWQYVTIIHNPPIYKNFDWIAFEKIWVFGCPGEYFPMGRSITTYGICDQNAVIDAGLASMEIDSPNLPSFDVSEPAVEFHGAEVSGLGDVLLTSVCGPTVCDNSPPCDDPATRRVRSSGIGSSGQDGVEIKWRTARPPSGGGVTLGDILDTTGEAEMSMRKNYVGHVTLIKQRVRGTGGGTGVITPDFSELGCTEFMLTAYRDGQVVRQTVLPNLTPIDITQDQIICGPGKQLVYGWVTFWVWNPWPITGSYQTHWGVVGCMTMGVGGGNDPTFTDRVIFAPVNPMPFDGTASVEVTGRELSDIELAGLDSESVAACPADYNLDGFLDFFDYDDYVLAFETGTGNADFNGDGFTDFFDYDDYVLAFETGC